MKLIKQKVTKEVKKKVEVKAEVKKDNNSHMLKPFYSTPKESKQYYDVITLVNKTHVKISLLAADTGREQLSIVAKLYKEENTLVSVVKGIAKSYYTIMPKVRVNYDLVPISKYIKPDEIIIEKAIITPFAKWYKDKLQELAGLLDEYDYGYITKNLLYTINNFEEKVVVDIVVNSGGIIVAGNHRFVFSYRNKEYLYFHNKKLDKKTSSLRDIFKINTNV